MAWREHAMPADGVRASRRDEGGEAATEGGTVGYPRGPAGRIRAAEAILDATVGAPSHPSGGDERTEQVASETLEAGAVARIGDGVGVEREAIDPRAAVTWPPRWVGRARRRRQEGELDRLDLGMSQLVDLGLGVLGVLGEHPGDAADDAGRDGSDLLVGRRWQRVVARRSGAVGGPHPVGDERVEMEVGVDERAGALDGGDRAGVRVDETARAGAPAMKRAHGTDEEVEHPRDKCRLVEQASPQPAGKRQRPLAGIGHRRPDMIDEVRRGIGHPSAIA